jgi:hypothetical protein
VSVLQQVLLLASACVHAQHVPDADIQHRPQPDVVYAQGFSANFSSIEAPIEIDLLRGKSAGGQPLQGKTRVATAVVTGSDASLLVPGQPPVGLSAACPPAAAPSRR